MQPFISLPLDDLDPQKNLVAATKHYVFASGNVTLSESTTGKEKSAKNLEKLSMENKGTTYAKIRNEFLIIKKIIAENEIPPLSH